MAHIEPPDTCPICGMAEDWRDTNDGRVTRVAYMCGAKWAQYNAHRVPLSPPEWVSDCSHAMDACLRTGATLHPTARETATAALVAAAAAWRTARINWLAADETDLPEAEHMEFTVREHDAAHVLQLAVRDYLATVTP